MKMKVYICLLFFSLFLAGCDGKPCEDCYHMGAGDTLYVNCEDENATMIIDYDYDNITLSCRIE